MGEPATKLSLRSQEWIETALFQLMEKKAYSDISITEIADRAGVARQTFYRNFQDKDDVLFHYLRSLIHTMWAGFAEKQPATKEMFAQLFRNWQQSLPSSLFQNIVGKDRKVRQIIFRSLSDYTDELFTDRDLCPQETEFCPYRLYSQKAFASLIHLMLVEWTLQEFQGSPEEIGGLVSEMTAAMQR